MRLVFRVASIVALAILGGTAAHADLNSASEAIKAKDYQKAFTELKELAELGHPVSQHFLGVMYFNGQGVPQNRLVGYGWVRLAADAGYEPAKQLEPKLRAEIDEENVERARGLLSRFSPDALSSRIYPKVLDNCDYQDIVPAKPVIKERVNDDGSLNKLQHSKSIQGLEYPQELINKGIEGTVAAEMLIGDDGSVRDARIVYAVPSGAFEDAVLGFTNRLKYTPATDNGRPVVTTQSMMFSFRITGSHSSSKGDSYVAGVLAKAEQGDITSQYVYGLIIAGYPNYRKPWSEVLPWFIKAAQGGLAVAQYQVGHSLLSGHGCEKDLVKAREWLVKAAQQDHSDAQIELARLALRAGPYYEPDKAIFWLENATKNDSIKAKKYLASILAASSIEKLRDPKRAQVLINEVLKADPDDIVSLEAKAAALAATGKFDQAATIEQSALKLAKRRDWNTRELEERLAIYNQKQSWQGELLMF